MLRRASPPRRLAAPQEPTLIHDHSPVTFKGCGHSDGKWRGFGLRSHFPRKSLPQARALAWFPSAPSHAFSVVHRPLERAGCEVRGCWFRPVPTCGFTSRGDVRGLLTRPDCALHPLSLQHHKRGMKTRGRRLGDAAPGGGRSPPLAPGDHPRPSLGDSRSSGTLVASSLPRST